MRVTWLAAAGQGRAQRFGCKKEELVEESKQTNKTNGRNAVHSADNTGIGPDNLRKYREKLLGC